MIYLQETNINVFHWLMSFYEMHPIPRNGNWDEVSGDAFLRLLLSMPVQEARFTTGRDSMYDCVVPCGVDPRSIAQRIMEIRSQLAKEFIQDLNGVTEENSVLLRETLASSLKSLFALTAEPPSGGGPAGPASQGTPIHPEMLEATDFGNKPSGSGNKPGGKDGTA